MNDKIDKKRYFTIQELASLAGVSTSGLRAWERRHDLFRPERTPAGHRLYTSDDLKLFWYVSHLRGEGWDLKRISGLGRDELLAQALAHFSSQDVEAAAGSAPGSHAPLSVGSARASLEGSNPLAPLARAQIGRRTYEIILDALARGDFETALGGLEKLYTVTENNLEFADACIELMAHVGEAWHAGRISVAAEHTLTSRVKHLLLGLLYLKQAGSGDAQAPIAVCATLPGELHELGLLRIAVYLREWGFRVTYVGANTPIAALEDLVRQQSPGLVAISVTTAMNAAFLNQNLQKLAMAIGHRVPVVVGGSGARCASRALPEMRMLTVADTVQEFEGFCRRILAGESISPHSASQVLT